VNASAVAVTASCVVVVVADFDDKNRLSLPNDKLAASKARPASLFSCSDSGEGKFKDSGVKEEASFVVFFEFRYCGCCFFGGFSGCCCCC